jgi:hypothetical protein
VRAARVDAVGRRAEDLLDDAGKRAVAQTPHVGSHALARNREGDGDRLASLAGDSVPGSVQAIDVEIDETFT